MAVLRLQKIMKFIKKCLTTLRGKGFSPEQCIKIILRREPKLGCQNISWAVAQAIAFIEISQFYDDHCDRSAINFLEIRFEAESSDDDVPF